MTRIVFDGDPSPIHHPLWTTYFTQAKDTHDMIPTALIPDPDNLPPLTHAESKLYDQCLDHIAALTSLPAHDKTDLESIQREQGWIEAISHLARRKGLSLAGQVEAHKVLDASREWVAEYTGEAGHER